MANQSLLTPKERARLVLNSSFSSNINRLLNAHKRRIASLSRSTKSDHVARDPVVDTIHSDPSTAEEVEDSNHWHNPSDFYVSMLNFCLGFGTVLGFPRLCYQHGGGIFIVPYLIMLCLEGIPLVCLEIALGQQFQDKFLVRTWKSIHPSTIGIGISAVFVSFAVINYFNIVVAWCLSYFVHSLQSTLPWSSCPKGLEECLNHTRPSEYYWYKTTLGASNDISSMRSINWNLYLYVVISWFLIFIYNAKGMRAAVKPGYIVLIVTSVLYVALFLLVVHLKDWARGLAILVDVSQVNKLLSIDIWRDAATQVFFTFGIGFGSIIVYASYNDIGFKCTTAALWFGVCDTVVGICSCIIVFSFRGFQAYTEKTKCLDSLLKFNSSGTASQGSTNCNKSFLFEPFPDAFSFAFIYWSDSFTHIPNPPVWSAFSYLLLFLIGFGSMSGMVHIVALLLRELAALRQEVATGIVCFICCLLGLLFVTDSGLYVVNMFSTYSACSLQWIVLFEVLSVICISGRKNFCSMVEGMIGQPVNVVWKLCWFLFSPVILITLIALDLYDKANIKEGYEYSAWKPFEGTKNLLYPSWCYVLISLMCLLPILFIFGVFGIYSVRSRHVLWQMGHNSWKRFWYWCRKEEEYELQDFAEVQRRYQTSCQVSIDHIDANFPELLSFDHISTAVKNGRLSARSFYNYTISDSDTRPIRHLSI